MFSVRLVGITRRAVFLDEARSSRSVGEVFPNLRFVHNQPNCSLLPDTTVLVYSTCKIAAPSIFEFF